MIHSKLGWEEIDNDMNVFFIWFGYQNNNRNLI